MDEVHRNVGDRVILPQEVSLNGKLYLSKSRNPTYANADASYYASSLQIMSTLLRDQKLVEGFKARHRCSRTIKKEKVEHWNPIGWGEKDIIFDLPI